MKAAFKRALRSFTQDDGQKGPDISLVLRDVFTFDEGKTKVIEAQLYLRDYSLKLQYNQESDSWSSILESDCNARAVITIETACTLSGSSATCRFFAFADKPRTSALKLLKKRSTSGLDAADIDVTIDGTKGKVAICIWYDALSESSSWYPTSAERGNVATIMERDGYELAETVSGLFPLSLVTDYLRVARSKVFTEIPINASPEITRSPGLYSPRHFCTLLFEYLLFITKTWKERINEEALGYQVEMTHRVRVLSKERKAIVRHGEEFNEPNIRIRREY